MNIKKYLTKGSVAAMPLALATAFGPVDYSAGNAYGQEAEKGCIKVQWAGVQEKRTGNILMTCISDECGNGKVYIFPTDSDKDIKSGMYSFKHETKLECDYFDVKAVRFDKKEFPVSMKVPASKKTHLAVIKGLDLEGSYKVTVTCCEDGLPCGKSVTVEGMPNLKSCK